MRWGKRLLTLAVGLALMVFVPVMAAQAAESLAPEMVTPSSAGVQYGGRESPSPATMAADAVLVRPLGLAATAVGAVLFVVSLPFSAVAGNVGEAGHALVVDPAKMTFDRPLGHFKH